MNILAISGDVALNTRPVPTTVTFEDVLPARLEATAFDGSLSVQSRGTLFPSAQGNLSLLAADNLRLFHNRTIQGTPEVGLGFRLSDADAAALLPSPTRKLGSDDLRNIIGALADVGGLNLHANDLDPVRLYALNGDITGGTLGPDSLVRNALIVDVPKTAFIQAGRDIVDLNFRGRNYRGSDVTRIVAGRDITYTRQIRSARAKGIDLAGPGTLDVEAGRNIGPFASEPLIGAGIRSTGPGVNTALGFTGADVRIRFGVAPGKATDVFAEVYLNSPSVDGLPDFRNDLLAYVQAYINDRPTEAARFGVSGSLTFQSAWEVFKQFPDYRRQILVERVFQKILNQVGLDFNDPANANFQKYSRGYQAINTLFPASFGYTANALDGGPAGAQTPVVTGNFDMRGSTVQTLAGGNIDFIAPGGQIVVGSTTAPPAVLDIFGNVIVGPSQQGILAVGTGNIGIFADRSILLAQSRIFTERGGDISIWSSNGDINAGKGVKSSASGGVTGAGIATLQLTPDSPLGDVVLVAPRGTVDAGDAGIRVAGDIFVAAQSVANADNIKVGGASVGVPVPAAVDSVSLLSASNTRGAVVDDAASRAGQSRGADRDSIIIVEVLGYGGGAGDAAPGQDNGEEERRQRNGRQSYNYDQSSPFQVVGAGELSPYQREAVIQEKARLGGQREQ